MTPTGEARSGMFDPSSSSARQKNSNFEVKGGYYLNFERFSGLPDLDKNICFDKLSLEMSDSRFKHGDGGNSKGSRSVEYQAWVGLRNRCLNPKNQNFPSYGGRGISVCPRWEQYSSFLADMGRRPSKRHSINRKDNDGNYEPGNCHWATPDEQNINRKKARSLRATSQFKGVGLNNLLKKHYTPSWKATIQKDGIAYHLGSFETEIEAALAYDRKAKEFFGSLAYQNFPSLIAA